jgi:hypothetical protein
MASRTITSDKHVDPERSLKQMKDWLLIAKANLPDIGGGVSADRLLQLSQLVERLFRAVQATERRSWRSRAA